MNNCISFSHRYCPQMHGTGVPQPDMSNRILASTPSSVIYRSNLWVAEWHKNRVPCIIIGDDRPILVETPDGRICGPAVYIAPGKTHRVHFGRQPSRTLYLEGIRSSLLPDSQVARRIDGVELDWILTATNRWCRDQERELLAHFHYQAPPISVPSKLAERLDDLRADPQSRLSQMQLAQALGIERTQALKFFKASTGMTLRSYQIWKSIRGALEAVAAGADFQTAGLDNGYCDAAHFSRTFRSTFGLTLSDALAAAPFS
jgi:AraC-like DNA-binding protein